MTNEGPTPLLKRTPPVDLRELRLISRFRRKLSAICASEINRLHKILDDGGISGEALSRQLRYGLSRKRLRA